MTANDNPNNELTPKQQRAIDALLSEPTTKGAAETAGCAEVTLHRWLKQPAFQSALKAARAELLEITRTALQSAGKDAVETLKEVMNDTGAKGSERVSAAKAVLEIGLKLQEIFNMGERLKEIENKLKALEEIKP